MAQAKNFGHLGYSIPCPLMYMTSGELINIIFADTYWEHFSEYFVLGKEILKIKLGEINAVRNALAHFRPIKEDDVIVIKQNANQVLSKIEVCLIDMFKCPNNVPSNTNDGWYKNFSTLGNELCSFSFCQSKDEKWIEITFSYDSAFILSAEWNTYRQYRVLSIKSPAILQLFPVLRGAIVFLHESLPHGYMNKTATVPKLNKKIHMLLSREALISNHNIFKTEMENLLSKITEETNLLKDDKRAKGELVYYTEVG